MKYDWFRLKTIEYCAFHNDTDGSSLYKGKIIQVDSCYDSPLLGLSELHYNFRKYWKKEKQDDGGGAIRLYNNRITVTPMLP